MQKMLFLVALSGLATPLVAQRDSLIGRQVLVERIRVQVHRGDKPLPSYQGVVEAVQGDTLQVRLATGDLMPVWPAPDRLLSVYQGEKSALGVGIVTGTFSGAAMGLVAGLMSAAGKDIAASGLCFSPPDCGEESTDRDVLGPMAVGAGMGFVLGAILGAAVKRPIWKPDAGFVPVGSVAPVITGLRGGRTGVGVSIHR